MHDLTMQAIDYALDGLSMRSQAIADNLANAELPGFRPSRVSFESQLQSALREGSLRSVAGPVTTQIGGVTNGINQVSVGDEMVEMVRTGLIRDAMVAAYNFKTTQLSTAISGMVS